MYKKADWWSYFVQVALFPKGGNLGQQFCGGTLVGNRYVITAAHCTDWIDYTNISVSVGNTILGTSLEIESFEYGKLLWK